MSMSLPELKSKLTNAANRARSLKDKADAVVDQALQTVEVGGVALVSGLADGYTGTTLSVGGVPADLLGAVGLHGFAAFSGMKNGHHLANMGDGLIAAFAVKQGLKMGKKMKDNKDNKGSVFGDDGEVRQIGVGAAQPSYAPSYGQTQAGLQTYAGG